MTNPADIEYLDELVARVRALNEHAAAVRRNSIASLHTPNFVLVETEPVFPEPMLIPQPVPPAQPKLSAGRIVAGFIGAVVCVVCAATSVMLLLVQT